MLGWGASCDLGQTRGHWLVTETGMSINALELKAGLFGLQSLLPSTCRHVRMMMDNTTVVACVNKMGTSHSKHCNMITKQIWDFCIEKGVWLSAAHVLGRENVDADLESRKINYDTEWKLNTELLQQAFHILGVNPDLDLFASRINTQLSSYVSFKPDPGAKAVDAFTLNWHDTRFYAFPPFCVIPKVLQMFCRDRAKRVVVVPDWPNQPWFPLIAKMLINYPVLVSARKNLLSLPQSPAEEHRLQKLRLIICELSGVASDAQGFRNNLQTSCVHPGEPKPKRDMPAMWQSGAGRRRIDPISPSISEAVNFLAHLYKSGLGYSAICVARSALSSYLNIADVVDFGQHKIVRRFMKGVFELKPVLPKYSHTWDGDTVLNLLECYAPNDKLTLKELSHKLVMLLALLTGQRCQTIHKLSVKSMKSEDNKCVFYITSLLKQSKQGKHLAPIELLSFPRNKNICVVGVIKEYLRRTKMFRDGHTQFLLSYLKPHLPISKDTLARWIRDVLHKAGVDTQFGAHSTHSASTSAAASKGLPIDIVLKAAGWSSASTFTRFYKREPVTNMGQTILESYFHQK